MSKKPDFFIVGAPKSGTSAMNHYLARHPDVYMAKKELHFFGNDLCFGSGFYRRDQRAYMDEFANRNGHRFAGEASVWYLFSSHAAREMKVFNPDARVIVMLREPTEMLYSLYSQFRYDANEPLPTFEEALAAEPERRAGRCLSRLTYFAQGLMYREAARYCEQIRRYFDAFGRERVHVVVYDDFAADPQAAYRGVLGFLGLQPANGQSDFRVINGNKTVKSPALRALLSDPLVRSTARTVGRRLPRPVFATLQRLESLFRAANDCPEKRAPLPPPLCAQLKREFRPEVEKISKLLGRDLTHWSK